MVRSSSPVIDAFPFGVCVTSDCFVYQHHSNRCLSFPAMATTDYSRWWQWHPVLGWEIGFTLYRERPTGSFVQMELLEDIHDLGPLSVDPCWWLRHCNTNNHFVNGNTSLSLKTQRIYIYQITEKGHGNPSCPDISISGFECPLIYKTRNETSIKFHTYRHEKMKLQPTPFN